MVHLHCSVSTPSTCSSWDRVGPADRRLQEAIGYDFSHRRHAKAVPAHPVRTHLRGLGSQPELPRLVVDLVLGAGIFGRPNTTTQGEAVSTNLSMTTTAHALFVLVNDEDQHSSVAGGTKPISRPAGVVHGGFTAVPPA